jgi:hydroxymethylglutaryl-CoA lyase
LPVTPTSEEKGGERPEVLLCEVGPRDGLQNEPETVPVGVKRELLARLAAAGLRSIEVTSFVSPKWIPQLADADALAGSFEPAPGVSYAALVPNEAGWRRFEGTGIGTAAFFVSASESHNRKNVNRGIAEHLERFRPVAEQARAAGARLRCYVSTVCGCPYEGAVAPEAVVSLVRDVRGLGADEISLGDTIGVGVPGQVRELVAAVSEAVPLEHVALHLHDTWGRALANVQAGYEAGVRRFDASLGGLGGCPYAPGASGNVATEDVVDLFEREGVSTGVDLDALVDTTVWMQEQLGRTLPGRVFKARLGQRQREEGRR